MYTTLLVPQLSWHQVHNCRMAYQLQYTDWEHREIISESLLAWAKTDQVMSLLGFLLSLQQLHPQDIYLVSREGHRIYTSQRLLNLSSSFFTSLLPSTSALHGLSLPYSSSSLSSLLSLLTTGQATSTARRQEVDSPFSNILHIFSLLFLVPAISLNSHFRLKKQQLA